MRLLITGICGFVGSTLARCLLEEAEPGGRLELFGADNLSRPGSELNRDDLRRRGVRVFHVDLRNAEDVSSLPAVDWVIDAAANPSVLAGVDGRSSTRQVLDHNLVSTIHLMEFCRAHRAGFILMSTSRVYSIAALAGLPTIARSGALTPDPAAEVPRGVSSGGLTESFSVEPPLSIYGVSKLASEWIAREYGEDFGFPVWINRCGVLAGAGQFGQAEQGIFSYWIHSYLRRRPLKYIGFGGSGHQVRDCLHPRDLLPLLRRQMAHSGPVSERVFNIGGGPDRAISLLQLSHWCESRFGAHAVTSVTTPRPFDIPWLVMDSGLAAKTWDWKPGTGLNDILEEIARHAEVNDRWLELSAPL